MNKPAATPINIAAIASVVTICTSLIGGFFLFDSIYARDADLQLARSEIKQLSTELKAESRKNAIELRRSMIEDQLFELDMKVEDGSATSTDRARIKRYQRQLRELR